MAPPAKAPKSDVTLKVYNITIDIRRFVDLADRKAVVEMKAHDYNEALAKARELVKYLDDKVKERLTLAGSQDNMLRQLNMRG